MSQKIYVIRKSAYDFSDEYGSELNLGAITDTFTDEAIAYARLVELEVPKMRTLELWDIEPLAHDAPYDQYKIQREALDTYLKQEFGESFLTVDPDNNMIYAEVDTYLPPSLTDAQVMKIREISGIRFHEMGVFEDEVIFYAIWLPQEEQFYQVDIPSVVEAMKIPRDNPEGKAKLLSLKNAIYFFNSYDEALAYMMKYDFYHRYCKVSFNGTLEELSNQPTMLESFIENTDGIEYDADTPAIVTDYKFKMSNLVSLNTFLKQPLFEIREFSYEQAIDVPHRPFEL